MERRRNMRGKTIREMNIGDTNSFRKTISETDVYLFAGITADMNPIHIDRQYAASSQFAKPIAHGIIGVGILSGVMARELPGGVYLSQTIKFLHPVFIGDTITALARVIKKDEEKDLITFRTWCENQDGVVVMDGEALGLVKKDVNV
jgi:3-hydroxybutyryl-CoA dehydratase